MPGAAGHGFKGGCSGSAPAPTAHLHHRAVIQSQHLLWQERGRGMAGWVSARVHARGASSATARGRWKSNGTASMQHAACSMQHAACGSQARCSSSGSAVAGTRPEHDGGWGSHGVVLPSHGVPLIETVSAHARRHRGDGGGQQAARQPAVGCHAVQGPATFHTEAAARSQGRGGGGAGGL